MNIDLSTEKYERKRSTIRQLLKTLSNVRKKLANAKKCCCHQQDYSKVHDLTRFQGAFKMVFLEQYRKNSEKIDSISDNGKSLGHWKMLSKLKTELNIKSQPCDIQIKMSHDFTKQISMIN